MIADTPVIKPTEFECSGECKEAGRWSLERPCCQWSILRLWRKFAGHREGVYRAIGARCGEEQAQRMREAFEPTSKGEDRC